MSRHISMLAPDLHRWVERTEEDAKYGIAETALEKASENAPVWSGFLADQGYAFVNGELHETTQEGNLAEGGRVPIPPEGNYNSDVNIVFTAGRPTQSGQPFDYAYYVGIKNPNWLRFANTKHWIETALHPANDDIQLEITKSFDKNWKLLQRP